MPKDSIVFFKDEIDERITPKKPINESGYVYVGREFKGKYVECIILKTKESNNIKRVFEAAPTKSNDTRLKTGGEHD